MSQSRRSVSPSFIRDGREARGGNWCGRIFWVLVSCCCLVGITVQAIRMKDIITTYRYQIPQVHRVEIEEERHFLPGGLDTPTFRFCNELWEPSGTLFDGYINCAKKGLSDTEFWACAHEYLKSKLKEELVHGILSQHPNGVYAKFLSDVETQDRVNIGVDIGEAALELMDEVRDHHDGSLRSYVHAKLATYGSPIPAHGVAVLEHDRHIRFDGVHDYDQIASYMGQFTDRQSRLASSIALSTAAGGNQGVCWDMGPFRPDHLAASTLGRTTTFAVVHFGGYSHGLQPYLEADITEKFKFLNYLKYKPAGQDLADGVTFDFTSTAAPVHQQWPAVGTSSRPYIRLSADQPVVDVKFWTKKSRRQNSRFAPCKHWAPMDQAHCNQRLRMASDSRLCEQYLPGSQYYPEVRLSEHTCFNGMRAIMILAKSEAARGGNSSAMEVIGQLYTSIKPAEDNLQTAPIWDTGAGSRNIPETLNENSEDCPRPCEDTHYEYSVSYPSSKPSEHCKHAVGSHILPQNRSKDAILDAFLFSKGHGLQAFLSAAEVELPCSMITFEQTESNGEILYEYYKYTPFTLVSDLAGAPVLWLGAFIISFVQVMKRCCAKKGTQDIDLLA